MPTPVKKVKKAVELHTWTQRTSFEVVNAALARAGKDPEVQHLGLDKLTRLVNYLLRNYAKGGKQ